SRPSRAEAPSPWRGSSTASKIPPTGSSRSSERACHRMRALPHGHARLYTCRVGSIIVSLIVMSLRSVRVPRYDLIVFDSFEYKGQKRHKAHRVGTATASAKGGFALFIPAGIAITGRV